MLSFLKKYLNFSEKINLDEISLRPATPKDFELTFALKKEGAKRYIDKIWGWDEAEQIQFHTHEFILEDIQIILHKNETIGMLDIDNQEDRFFVKGFYLTKKYQSKGIGQYLLESLKKKGVGEGKFVELEVFKKNPRAFRFYKRLGFNVIDESESHFRLNSNK
jgi:ribosomal protein S18 acetylase RimI-like enzyme